jgi:hypothetical protein
MFRSSAVRFTHQARAFAHRDTQPSPYFIQRNSRGSVPVYTDVRNAGTRYLVLIRNIEGNVNVRPTPPTT